MLEWACPLAAPVRVQVPLVVPVPVQVPCSGWPGSSAGAGSSAPCGDRVALPWFGKVIPVASILPIQLVRGFSGPVAACPSSNVAALLWWLLPVITSQDDFGPEGSRHFLILVLSDRGGLPKGPLASQYGSLRRWSSYSTPTQVVGSFRLPGVRPPLVRLPAQWPVAGCPVLATVSSFLC